MRRARRLVSSATPTPPAFTTNTTQEGLLSAALSIALLVAPEDVAERVFAAWREGDCSVETRVGLLAGVVGGQGVVVVRVPAVHASPPRFVDMWVSLARPGV